MKYTLLCAYFLLVSIEAGSQLPIILDKNIKIVDGGFAALNDTSGHLAIRNILYSFNSKKFQLTAHKTFRPGFVVYWIHFTMLNRMGFDKEWILDFEGWSYVSAYIVHQDGTIDSAHKTGKIYPYRKRDYPVANKAYLLVPLKADSSVEFFIRLQSTLYTETVPTELGFRIAARSVIDAENDLYGKIVYVFLAFFFIMFVYNLFIYISTRIKSYAYYLILLILIFDATAHNSGYIVEIFGSIDSFPSWLGYLDHLASILLALSTLLFAKHFLQVKVRYPVWNTAINFIIVFMLFSGVILYLETTAGLILNMIGVVAIMIATIALAIKSTRDRYPSAKYFLAGYTVFFFSTCFIPLGYLHIIPSNIWTLSYSIAIGSTIEIVLFSFALADTINILRRENYENQKKQQSFLQEQENLKILFQQELLKTQLEIQEQTFRNISQEIHDNIGQILSLIKVNVDDLFVSLYNTANEKLSETRNLVIKVINDIRDLSKTLNTDFIHRIGLSGAIEQQVDLLRKTGKFEVQFVIEGEIYEYGSQSELVVFRIIQELLNNILKHSEATAIFVSMNYHQEKLVIIVHDNGKGFDILKVQSANNSLGLMNMKNRIKMINGSIDFNSQPLKGTIVQIELPLTYTKQLSS